MSTRRSRLPEFIPPMLAKRGAPFDSQEYLFEVKWDGIRAIALIDTHGYRLMRRSGLMFFFLTPPHGGVFNGTTRTMPCGIAWCAWGSIMGYVKPAYPQP